MNVQIAAQQGAGAFWSLVASVLPTMKTRYLRNVPDDVVARLQTLADRDGMSLSALALRELADVSRRANNAALLDSLPDHDIEVSKILEALDRGRAGR